MKTALALIVLLLAGCSGGSHPQPVGKWLILYSQDVPPSMIRDGSEYYFVFPTKHSGVHYVQREQDELKEGATIRMRFRIEGKADYRTAEGGTPAVRLMIQRKGDDLSNPDGRFWSHPEKVDLNEGAFSLTVRLTDNQWTNVLGRYHPSGFADCIENIGYVGFTFGGTFFGHGVTASNPVKFVLEEYSID